MKQIQLFLILLGAALIWSCDSSDVVEEQNGVYTDRYSVDAEGRRHGEFRRLFGGDTLAELSHYEHGLLHGQRTIYHPSGGPEIEEIYVEDTLHGPYKVYGPDGTLTMEGQYEHGVMKGMWKRYYPGGGLMEEVTFDDNLENGPFVEYYENGKLKAKGQYKGGDFEQDTLYLYRETGELERKMLCNNGICNTFWTLDSLDNGG